MVVERERLIPVGVFHMPDQPVQVFDATQLNELRKWLGIELGDSDRLDAEMRGTTRRGS